ncbi:hypothetical protein T440DRAFT_95158 [Plenodomus tracheiphilus IPT5]|uniref:EGF-like domain-containing protein n=1 Tax=Plenodomus tracheiphilus IPT5 TaxID=1408161 RepID=A0A6A7BMG7_9PLEO|nr:hypothetical protein T440DRAFT_95158 [Plenodomus tracheiphilus IPT5]
MKLTLSALTVLSCTLYSVDAEFPKIRNKLHHHPYDPTFEPSKVKYNLHHLPLPPALDQAPKLPKRKDILSPGPDPPLQTPSSSLTLNFLPPPWSPSSNLGSPYPLTGVSPYDDSGRSEILDNEPSIETTWRTCPDSNLDCSKCPRDKRCRHKGTPWWQVDPTITIDDGGLVADVCPLTTCTAAPGACGKNAKCVREHCVCETGWKGTTGNVRGFEGLQALTVWVDSGVDCDVKCDGWGCEEVQQVGACFGMPSSTALGTNGVAAGVDDVEVAGTGGGAVKVPGTGDGEASRVRRNKNYCGA